MSRPIRLCIVSDVHYACDAERERRDYLQEGIHNPLLRLANKIYRHFIWLRDPFGHNHLLDEVLNQPEPPDFVVANGDYSCDTRFIGVSDDAACQSAVECLQKLRQKFAPRFQAILGDHELGKASLGGGLGGLRLASYYRAQEELELQRFWQVTLGNNVLLGLASTLVAFPIYEPDSLSSERPEWQRLREEHLAEIRRAFVNLHPDQRVLLFCHDPSALAFLWREETVRSKLSQLDQTIIGHLHSNLVFWKSRLLAGMPPIHGLGNTCRRLSSALREAKCWKHFKVRLCPSLAGIELLKDGGYYTAELNSEARQPALFRFHPIRRLKDAASGLKPLEDAGKPRKSWREWRGSNP